MDFDWWFDLVTKLVVLASLVAAVALVVNAMVEVWL
jgi:hypothetical protein